MHGMNFLFLYRIFFISALAILLPLALSASARINSDYPVQQFRKVAALPMFQDSAAARKKNAKDAGENQRPSQDVREERLKEIQRRAIKEVPRSIPKLKPKPVTERINIRRPPIKVPKKGMGGNIRF